MKKSNTYSFAERELDILSKSCTDPEDRPLIEPFRKEILALCEKFGKSGQSGGSAPYTATAISQAVKKLMLQEPIAPVTGIDEEWCDVSEQSDDALGTLYQNNRCSALFKDKTGCWYLDAISWKGPHGNNWHSNSVWNDRDKAIRFRSRQYVKSFPFTPKTFYVDILEEEVEPDNWEFYVKDMKQLDKVWKYYSKPENV